MNESAPTPIAVDTLMARIRAEVARRKQVEHAANPEATAAVASHFTKPIMTSTSLNPLPLPHLPKPQFVPADRFQLNDFLALHDEDFIEAIYRGLLQRPPDTLGRAHYLECLRAGRLSKIEILGRLRYSPEGRRRKVPVRGLAMPFAFQHSYRLPVLGRVIAFFIALARLPRLAKTLQGLEGYQHLRNNELEAAIRNLALVAAGNERLLNVAIDNNVNQTQVAVAGVKAQIDALGQRVDVSVANVAELAGLLSAHKEQAGSEQRGLVQQIENAESELRNLAQWRVEATLAHNDFSARIESVAALVATNHGGLNTRIDEIAATQQVHESRLASVEGLKQSMDQQLVDAISLSQQTSNQLAATLRDALGVLEQRVEGLGKAVQSEQGQSQGLRMRMIERVARLEGRVHEQGLRGESLAFASATTADAPAVSRAASESRFDRIYVAFEQRFRGSREDIRQRLSYYLPLLRESAVGSEGAAVLDIGCGRGEWLELLRDENISARGVDINVGMAQQCIERGLDVHIGDAIAYLKQLPDNALGALSGFHIIEHISLDLFLELIEQAHRVLQPGGLVIFETPNPENLIVGACNFYIDPTHQRPLPPVLSQFLVESGGFVDVAIHRVNANLLPQFFEEPAENDPPALRTAINYLRNVFLCAPDYSVVGHVA
jgi:SAM-dependent methyltransferase